MVRNLRARPRCDRGLTLLEVIIALAVLAAALFAIFSMILHTMQAKESMRELAVAKEAAAAKIEEIKSQSWANIPGFATGSVPLPVAGLTDPAGPSGQGRCTITIDTTNQEVYQVAVRIEWKGSAGQRTYEMTNLIAK
jgi:prepilin-type N-terminal cleavage/methylation domain-containing protein